LVLLTKLKTAEARLAYAARAVLALRIEQRTLDREGKAVTNFAERLPEPQSDLVRESLKDLYRFAFLTLGAEASEREIEDVFRWIVFKRDSREERFLSMGLRELAVAMMRHRRGGTALFVASKTEVWQRYVQNAHAVSPAHARFRSAFSYKCWAVDQVSTREIEGADQAHVQRARETASDYHAQYMEVARTVAQFTAIDGALVLDRDLNVHGIGAKITADDYPEKVLARRYTAPGGDSEEPFESVGGTRHQSAVRFVFAMRDAFALVASQDRVHGRGTVVADYAAVAINRESPAAPHAAPRRAPGTRRGRGPARAVGQTSVAR
jgi:hypothetical protein